MKRRWLSLTASVIVAAAFACYWLLSPTPAIADADALADGTTRAEVEATFGRPVWTTRNPANAEAWSLFELRDGWVGIDFDADDRLIAANTIAQGWYERKRGLIHMRFGW